MTELVADDAAAPGIEPLLSAAGIASAMRWLTGRVTRTAVVRSEDLDRWGGARLWLKAENLQRAGSFKIRGALLATERLARAGSRGVIAQSTGNHALAVAVASREYGLPAVLVLPEDAPAAKVSGVREAGGTVVFAGTALADRLSVVDDLSSRHGYDVIDPYENHDVVLGQGTATAELVDQVNDAGARLDSVVVPVGGGSALAGACLAVGGRGIAVTAAEPDAVPALTAALAAGKPVTVAMSPTIADGLRPNRIARLPFDLCRTAVADVVTVPEQAIAEATCLALMHAKLLIEPAAATALAVAIGLVQGTRPRGTDVGVLLTGGNVDTRLVAALLSAYPKSTLVACSVSSWRRTR